VQSRPRNAATTRAAILDAARDCFVREAYDRVGVRQIAGEAGVDAALICRYFGSKEELFAEVLSTLGGDPMEVFAGKREDFGWRVARAMLDPDCCPERESMEFLNVAVRSTMSPSAGRLVRRHIEKRFIGPLSGWLGGADAISKAWLTASILSGVALMRSIACGPDCSGGEAEAAISRLAALLQAVADG
jgi:AcrR family transcriptional regulator